MLEAFRILDPNGTGSVDLSRMRAMMNRLWPQDEVGRWSLHGGWWLMT
jgi:hypothetical protein